MPQPFPRHRPSRHRSSSRFSFHRENSSAGSHSGQSAVIYCRVSSVRQSKEGNGLGSQEQRCRSYASACDYNVLDVFPDDGVSGALLDRPGIRSLLAFLRSQPTSVVVIVDDISRIARDVKTHLALRTAIAAAGGLLESPSMRFEESAAGEFIEMVLAASAQFGRKGNREQVLNRQQARLQSGYWTFPLPPGYTYHKHPVHKKIAVPTPEAKQVLGPALQAFAEGRLGSQRLLGLHLQAHGFFGPSNHDSVTVLEKRVDRILCALPFYAGWIEYPPWNILRVPAQHEPILDATSLARLETRFARAPHVMPMERLDARPEFPLRGFVRCPGCGRPFTGCLAKGRYPRYFCYAQGKCPRYGWSHSARLIEPAFEDLLRFVTPGEDLLEFMHIMLTSKYRHRLGNYGFERKTLEKELELKEEEVSAMVRRLAKTTNEAIITALEKEVVSLQGQQAQVIAKLADLEKAPPDYEAAWEHVSTYLRDPAGIWKNGSLKQKRTVHQMVFTVPPAFDRNAGFSTYELSLPYQISVTYAGSNSHMVEVASETWQNLASEISRLSRLAEPL